MSEQKNENMAGEKTPEEVKKSLTVEEGGKTENPSSAQKPAFQAQDGADKDAGEQKPGPPAQGEKSDGKKKKEELKKIVGFSVILETHYDKGREDRQVLISKANNYIIAAFLDKGRVFTMHDGISPMAASFITDLLKQELMVEPIQIEKRRKQVEIYKKQQALQAKQDALLGSKHKKGEKGVILPATH